MPNCTCLLAVGANQKLYFSITSGCFLREVAEYVHTLKPTAFPVAEIEGFRAAVTNNAQR